MAEIIRVRKKPVEVEAIHWHGDNLDDLRPFLGDTPHKIDAANQLWIYNILEEQFIAAPFG
ncbi:MAG: hypothetical protein ACODAG_12785, partial [Myxococcota bacterium]